LAQFAGQDILEDDGPPRRPIHNLRRREFLSEANQRILIQDTMAVGSEIFFESNHLDKRGVKDLVRARRSCLMNIGDTRGSMLGFWLIQGRAVIRNSCAAHARLNDVICCGQASCKELGGCARFGNRLEDHNTNRYVYSILLFLGFKSNCRYFQKF